MNSFVCLLSLAICIPALVLASAPWEHYNLNYNFQDVLAQSTCTSLAPAVQRVWALRRQCSGSGEYTCAQVCKRLNQRLTCFEAIHVYKQPNILAANPGAEQPDEVQPGLSMARYGRGSGCNWKAGHCGPNYCCCYGVHNALTTKGK